MHCSQCGEAQTQDARFCSQCGAPLDDAASQAGPEETGTRADMFRQATQDRPPAGSDREETLWTGGYSGKDMVPYWIGAAAISVIAAVACVVSFQSAATAVLTWIAVSALSWLIPAALLLYRRFSVHYQLTNQRFVHQHGILRRVTDRIEVIDIDDVRVEQGIIQRLLGVGTIHVISSDRSHPELRLAGIDKVAEIAGLMDDVRRQERRKRGLHIESI